MGDYYSDLQIFKQIDFYKNFRDPGEYTLTLDDIGVLKINTLTNIHYINGRKITCFKITYRRHKNFILET